VDDVVGIDDTSNVTSVDGGLPTSTVPLEETDDGAVAGAFVAPYCPYFTEYIRYRRGGNDLDEVLKIQKFLNIHMNAGLDEDSVFGIGMFNAVKEFQSLYPDTVLLPWFLGVNKPTGYWYKTTRKQANTLVGCDEGVVRLENGVVVE
ncbi:MAG: hypothetical protein OEX08_03400, partial [Candidatus Nomurabacteria bacterium]|nr:hypothetical protein [Candidatus Nomurabacteria bacterium]